VARSETGHSRETATVMVSVTVPADAILPQVPNLREDNPNKDE